ncbi:MAG TPA: serine hydrolase domain-containing protein [Ktedonobacterales bacterium]
MDKTDATTPTFEAAFRRVDEYIQRRMRADAIPGLALAVTTREELLGVRAYGHTDLSGQRPVTPETLFPIASIGKSFTCLALLQQAERGRLDLHAPITKYLPWFQVRSRHAPITLHHLMSHSAGISMGTDFTPGTRYDVYQLREMEANPPGVAFHYSNVGYKALGFLLEDVLGQPYHAILQTGLLDPVGMRDTRPALTNDLRQRVAVGHIPLYDDRPYHPSLPLAPAPWLEYGAGDGSPASTPADLAIYARVLLNGGQGPQGRVVSEESFRQMISPAIQIRPGISYGYGVIVGEVDGHRCIWHDGEHVGYTSTSQCDLDDGLAVVVLDNGPFDAHGIGAFVLKTFRAALHQHALPDLPEHTPTRVTNAAEYVGRYSSDGHSFALEAANGELHLLWGAERVVLEPRGRDTFYVAHPEWSRFLLRFQRQDGQVAEATFGADWYTNERYQGPTTFEVPAEWKAYVGHYRSHNPWLSNFRVVLRKGKLVLLVAAGGEQELAQESDGSFSYSRFLDEQKTVHPPERLHFDTLVDGLAQRAILSGCACYRFFTE